MVRRVALLTLLCAPAAHAAPPLDPGFGSDGIAAAGPQGAVNPLVAAAARGRVLAAAAAGPDGATTLTRLSPGGDAELSVRLPLSAPAALAATRTGGAAVGGDGVVLRVGAQGALVGRSRVRGTVTGLTVARDGAIAVATALADGTFELARMRADGRADRRFGGGDGRLSIPGRALAPVPLPGGGLVLAYQATQDDGMIRVGTIRLTRRGVPDGTYGARGVRRVKLAGAERLAGVAVDARRRVLVAVTLAGGRTAVARLTRDGEPDRGFGSRGAATVPSPAGFDAAGLAAAARDDVVVGGVAEVGGVPRPAVARLTRTGRADPRFGSGGLALVDPTQRFAVTGFAFAAGRAVLAGTTDRPVAARFGASGR